MKPNFEFAPRSPEYTQPLSSARQRQPRAPLHDLKVTAIYFNHDPSPNKDFGRCALNLRIAGAGQGKIEGPEFLSIGKSHGAAWSAADILDADDAALAQGAATDRGPYIYVTLQLQKQGGIPISGVFAVHASGGGVLGPIPETEVYFDNGLAVNVPIQLREHKINDIDGVGHLHSGLAQWTWRVKSGNKAVSHAYVTTTEVCITAKVPQTPWTQWPFSDENLDLPWFNFLRIVCGAPIGQVSGTQDVALATRMARFVWSGDWNPFAILWGPPSVKDLLVGAEVNISKVIGNWMSDSNSIGCDCTILAPLFVRIANIVGSTLVPAYISVAPMQSSMTNHPFSILPVIPIGWNSPKLSAYKYKYPPGWLLDSFTSTDGKLDPPVDIAKKGEAWILEHLWVLDVHTVALLAADENSLLNPTTLVYDPTYWQNSATNGNTVDFEKWQGADTYGVNIVGDGASSDLPYLNRLVPLPKLPTILVTKAPWGTIK